MKKIVLFLILAVGIFKTVESSAQVTVQDSLALVDIYNSTQGDFWLNNQNWLSSNWVSTWYGVTVGGGRVTELDLHDNGLEGTIPFSIGNLTGLQYLDLSVGTVSDTIPSSIGNLTNLQYLGISDERLSGSIPYSIGNLTNLYQLDFSLNSLSGSIPSTIGSLTNIGFLDLFSNYLSGSIPSTIGNMTSIIDVELYGNYLSGSIPSSIGKLTNLQTLNLSYNQLSDSIPSAIGNPTNLEELYLNNNQLSGAIPATIGNLPNLEALYLNNNQFTFSGMEEVVQKIGGVVYSPQAYIPISTTGDSILSVSAGGTLANDTFHWYKNDTLVATNVGDSIYKISGSGARNYSVAVTNSIATELTLYSDSVVDLSDTLIMPDQPRVEYADRAFTGTDGWTNYYWDNNTPYDFTDDTLLLSLNTNGQNIGSIGDGTFAVKLVATADAGSGMAIKLTNPLITNPTGYWVMNRYWQVTPTTEPTANVGVRFYYNAQDLADVNGSYPTHNLTNQQLIFYKGVGGSADPTTNLEGATAIISILPSTYASDTTWTYHELTDTTSYAEFSVASFSGGGGGGTGNDQALPIKLLSFTAIKESGKNLLQWTTGQEVNSSYFSVERSGDGVDFTSIGQVGAAGNSSVAKNYSLVDAKPVNGMNYYRLKMMDKDGEFSYSEIRTINEAVSFGVSIYPNPVQNSLNLNFSSDKAETVQVEVLDNGGKVVATQEVEVAAGASTQGINVGGLSGGVYYVRLIGSDGEVEERFVKE